MRNFGILLVLLFTGCSILGQPVLRNSFTTNAPGKTPTILPTNDSTNLFFDMHINGDGSILQSHFNWISNNVYYGNGSGLTNVSGVWTNDPPLIYPVTGFGPYDTNGLSSANPPFVITTNSSLFVGQYVGQTLDVSHTSFAFPVVSSFTDSNQPNTIFSDWSVTDNSSFANYSDFNVTLFQNPSTPSCLLIATTATNSITAAQMFLQVEPGQTLFTLQDLGTNLLAVSNDGIVSVRELALDHAIVTNTIQYVTNVWSGPTNTVDLALASPYDLNYASFTACSITGFANKPTYTTSEKLLSIANLSATNFNVTLQAGIVDGDFTSTHTITNGTTGVFWLRYTPQGPRTNCVFRQL